MFVITLATALVLIMFRMPLQLLASGKSFSGLWVSIPISWLMYGIFGKIYNIFNYDPGYQAGTDQVCASLMVGFIIYTTFAIMVWEFVRYLFKITRLKDDDSGSDLPSSDG